MKATGIVRNIDQLGRIVVPKEVRRSLMIEEGDPLEIFVNGDQVILKPYKPNCVICGGTEEIKIYKSKKICSDCIEGLSNEK